VTEEAAVTRFAFPDLVRAFRDGEHFGDGTVRVCALGPLVLPTGAIVACDPGFLRVMPQPAFTRRVPPGTYPVLLSLLARGQPDCRDERVACAAVRFRDAPVQRWEMALCRGQDLDSLKPGHFFGYGVDGGRGCFVDKSAVAGLAPAQRQFAEALKGLTQWSYADFLAAMPAALRPLEPSAEDPALPGHAKVGVLDPRTGANVVSFSSGMGDGVYTSYFGLATDDSVVCLVTDFGLLVHAVLGQLELPVPLKARSELTHPDFAKVGIEKVRVTWDRARERITFRIGDAPYLQSLRFENRPGQHLGGTIQRGKYQYQLGEALQPTARLLLEYTARIEAL
jgi:hypothetical protein